MRFIVMHRTDARWEAGAIPGRELIANVGRLIGDMIESGVFLGAEGLRASSEGVVLTRSGGTLTVRKGPFAGDNELPAGFTVHTAGSLDAAASRAARLAEVLGDVEIEVRPVTEPWDIGLVPAPENAPPRRYMALWNATGASEAGAPLTPEQRAQMARLLDETRRDGTHVATEILRESRRGRRYRNSAGGVTVTDGPFTETKELIAGYVMLEADSLAGADRWARRYLEAVEAEEADLRELEEPPG